MSTGDEFKTYSWETDEGWIKIEKSFDFPAGYGRYRKRAFVEKRKLKYYKEKVNPDYEPGAQSASEPEPKEQETKAEEKKEEAEEKSEPQAEKTEDAAPPPTESSSTEANLQPGTFVKLNLNAAKYNGLMGEIDSFIASKNRYLVRLYLPTHKASSYRSEIKVKPENMTPTSKMPLYGEMFAHILFILFGVLSLVSRRFYSYALGVSVIVHSCGLLYLKGKPSTDQLYIQEALQCPQSMNLLGSLALFMAKPYMWCLMPPLSRHANRGFSMLSRNMSKDSPTLYAQLKRFVDPVLERKDLIKKFAYTTEVYLGCFLAGGILLGMSSMGSCFIYWNYLRMKYLFSPGLKLAFREFKYSIDQKLGSFPMVLPYWQKVCDFAFSYVDEAKLQQQAQQQAAGGGAGGMLSRMASSCNIM